jgi:hypothetical protein
VPRFENLTKGKKKQKRTNRHTFSQHCVSKFSHQKEKEKAENTRTDTLSPNIVPSAQFLNGSVEIDTKVNDRMAS